MKREVRSLTARTPTPDNTGIHLLFSSKYLKAINFSAALNYTQIIFTTFIFVQITQFIYLRAGEIGKFTKMRILAKALLSE